MGMIRFKYIISQILDFMFLILYWFFIFGCQYEILMLTNDRELIYTPALVNILFIVFVISYFFGYAIRHQKRTLGQKILGLHIENYENVSIFSMIFSNIVFWIGIGIILIRLVQFDNIYFHSVQLIIFGSFIYLLFLFLGIDFVSLFGKDIKFKEGER